MKSGEYVLTASLGQASGRKVTVLHLRLGRRLSKSVRFCYGEYGSQVRLFGRTVKPCDVRESREVDGSRRRFVFEAAWPLRGSCVSQVIHKLMGQPNNANLSVETSRPRLSSQFSLNVLCYLDMYLLFRLWVEQCRREGANVDGCYDRGSLFKLINQ